MPRIVAHRGASRVERENTPAAFSRAIEIGVDGIELDVHGAADGTLVVHHDPDVGGVSLSNLTAADLEDVTLPEGQRIPLLSEVLTIFGPDVTAYVEVKSIPAEHEPVLLDTLASGPHPNRYHVHSFDHRLVRRLKRQRAELVTGVLSVSYPVRPLDQLIYSGARELWQQESLIDRELVGMVHQAKRKLIAWTVDRPERMLELAELGVDGLCTNDPQLAREVLER